MCEMDVGERREWERMEKHRKDRKSVVPILLIQVVTKLLPLDRFGMLWFYHQFSICF